MTNTIMTQQPGRNKIHPKKFALWVACASMAMVFAAFTSAYMVRQAAGNWLEFPLPNIFFVNTLVIILSSAALQTAHWAFKRENAPLFRGLLLVAMFLGLAFMYLQYQGWEALKNMGIPLKLNPSGDFIYAISGVHLAHVLGGLIALLIAVLVAFSRPLKVTPARLLRLEMTLTYWHFVGGLWLYLIVFWTMHR